MLECPMSRCTWALSSDVILDQMSTHREGSAKSWIFAMNAALSSEECVRLVVTLWAIWSARRKAIHEDIFKSPQAIHGHITSYLMELNMLSQKNATSRSANQRLTGWLPPPELYAKLNVDVAVRTGRCGAVGAVCRDHDGAFLGASAIVFKNIDDPSTLEALALAVREGLALAADLNQHQIHLASDCEGVVRDVQRGSAAACSLWADHPGDQIESIVFYFM